MIARPRPLSQDLILRLAQFLVLVLASAVVVAFLRYNLEATAGSFHKEFERQSFVELNRGETFVIARKLAALGKSEQISCIKATKAGINFFEGINGPCEPGFLRVRETVEEPNQGISISFTLRMPQRLVNGLALFLAAQGVLAGIILLSQRRLLLLRHEHELALAALAQQVAHDIRSPLAILKGLAPAGSGPPGAALGRRALERLERLLSRLQGTGTEGEAPLSLGALLAGAVEEKLAELPGRAEIRVHWDDAVAHVLLPGSAFQWRALLSNLLNNSIEAGGSGEARIDIHARRRGSDGVSLSIRDAGKGMPAGVLARLGRRGLSHGKPGGRGLGFATAKAFVEGLGGRVGVESEEGKGATVTLEVTAFTGDMVVLVDDDWELAQAWSLAARRRGVRVEHYASPSELLSCAEGIPVSTPVYLDLDFGDPSEDAMGAGAQLHARGFQRLYLCTGRARGSFSRPAWAADIVDKTPPWL